MAKRRPKLTTLMNANEFPSSPSWNRILFPTRRPFDFSHEIKVEKTRERKNELQKRKYTWRNHGFANSSQSLACCVINLLCPR